jgi:hypothetical protein
MSNTTKKTATKAIHCAFEQANDASNTLVAAVTALREMGMNADAEKANALRLQLDTIVGEICKISVAADRHGLNDAEIAENDLAHLAWRINFSVSAITSDWVVRKMTDFDNMLRRNLSTAFMGYDEAYAKYGIEMDNVLAVATVTNKGGKRLWQELANADA